MIDTLLWLCRKIRAILVVLLSAKRKFIFLFFKSYYENDRFSTTNKAIFLIKGKAFSKFL